MPEIMGILLKDRTTGGNIIWATDSYASFGKGYFSNDIITIRAVCNGMGDLIRPRASKLEHEQETRTRDRAEVFTPTWVIKKQNDIIEEEFKNLELKEYVNKTWLEIACGEGPYIASRYDTVTGEFIGVAERVGFLDRKIQRISKKVEDYEQWVKLVQEAYKSSYGYEFQGDSLLLARENLLYTFMDYYLDKFDEIPEKKDIKEIARIISYNIFQMDGLNYNIPLSEEIEKRNIDDQLSMFADENQKQQTMEFIKEGTSVKIKNWESDRLVDIKEELKDKEEMSMKFDVVIGNPPYQKELKNTSDRPIYNDFMSNSYEIADKVCLITPGRFLFNAGKTPKSWNQKMLNDDNLKVIYYEEDSSNIFSNTDIKGGVAITYRDENKNFGRIGTFTQFSELKSILNKVTNLEDFVSIKDSIYGPLRFDLEEVYSNYPHYKKIIGSNGKEKRLTTSIFTQLDFFQDEKKSDNSIRVLGLIRNKRTIKYIGKKYIEDHPNLKKYKVLLPKANGTGRFGEALSTPVISEPLSGGTHSFISIGVLENKSEAESILKYIKTKFTRAMLGVLKVTQDNLTNTWGKVPVQDFTSNSDIDWNKSITEIDYQLYKKYNLDDEEINFIEKNVREME